MLRRIRRIFDEIVEGAVPAQPTPPTHGYRLATATLLVEMIRADFEVHATEERTVIEALQSAFELTPNETTALFDEAHACADEAISLHEFTTLINEHLDAAQKYHIIELLWQVAYADGAIDKYEEHFVRKVADLLYVRHRSFIRAKLSAEQSTAR